MIAEQLPVARPSRMVLQLGRDDSGEDKGMEDASGCGFVRIICGGGQDEVVVEHRPTRMATDVAPEVQFRGLGVGLSLLQGGLSHCVTGGRPKPATPRRAASET